MSWARLQVAACYQLQDALKGAETCQNIVCGLVLWGAGFTDDFVQGMLENRLKCFVVLCFREFEGCDTV